MDEVKYLVGYTLENLFALDTTVLGNTNHIHYIHQGQKWDRDWNIPKQWSL